MYSKLIYSIFLIISLTSQIFAQSNEVYICMIFKGDQLYKDGIYIDENLEIDYMSRENELKNVSIKTSGKDIFDNQLVFQKKLKEFSSFSKISLGAKFFISFPDKIIEEPVSYFSVTNTAYSGYELHAVMNIPASIYLPSTDFPRNVTVCSKYSNCSPINYENEKDNGVIEKIKNSLSKYTKNIKGFDEYINEEPDWVIIKGSFTEPGSTEYAVSYVRRRSFESFASGIFIVNGDGTKVTEVIPFLESDFNYNKVIAVVDYNGDGIYELLTENGYYEGAGYQLWKYSSPSFIMLTTGFNWGV